MRRSKAAIGALLLLAGCNDGVVRANIGAEGGTLEGYGAKLVIPAGALTETQELTLAVREGESPAATPLSPLYQFGPSGLQLAVPAHLDVAVPEGKAGLLYWSKPGNEQGFEMVGLAFGGKATGSTTHFSDAYVGEGMCELPPTTTKCACRADDEYGDLLCQVDPSMEGHCPDINGYSGQDGGSCSGYGARPDLHTRCYCYDTKLGYLCKDHIQFSPNPQCPTYGGLNDYVDVGEDGASCSGYINDITAMEDAELSGSGTLVDCYPESWGDVYDSHSGTLEGCYLTSAPEPTNPLRGSGMTGPLNASGATGDSCAPPGGEDDSVPSFSKDCLKMIADRENAGITTACPGPMDPKTVGTLLHTQIQARFVQGHPNVGRVEVWVPNANKKQGCVELVAPTKDDPQRNGRVDLVRIVSKPDADPVVVEIAEIKPLTRQGLNDGFKDIYACYAPHIEEQGPNCVAPQPGVQETMCEQLGAVGKTVALAKRQMVWGLDATFEWEPEPGVKRKVQVMSCGEGLVTYACIEDGKGQP